jgi:hypothetical protein
MRSALLAVATSVVLIVTGLAAPPAKQYPLENAEGLHPVNVTATPAVMKGKKGLRVTMSDEMSRKYPGMSPDDQAKLEQLVRVDGLEFADGIIEAEIAGEPAPGSFEGARGFVGIAFRLQNDLRTYDGFYLRPTNGRAEDQERRNHAAQYISHPDWPWFRLRKETPSKYESWVDLVPGEWTRIKIDVRGDKARLYVHDSQFPTLIVNDVKTGAKGTGGVALWLGPGTIAHFRDLRVQPASTP